MFEQLAIGDWVVLALYLGFFVVLLVWASTRGASFQLNVHRHKRFKIDPFGAMFEVAVVQLRIVHDQRTGPRRRTAGLSD